MSIFKAVFQIAADLLLLLFHLLRPRGRLAAENLFLRKQLAFYQERKVKPRRLDPASSLTFVLLSKVFKGKEALAVVRPAGLSPARHQPGDG